MEAAQRGLGGDGEAHALFSSVVSVVVSASARTASAKRSMSSCDVSSVTQTSSVLATGHDAGLDALGAERVDDALRAEPGAGHVDLELAQVQRGVGEADAADGGQLLLGVAGAAEQGLAELGHALRAHQCQVHAGGDAPERCGGADPLLAVFAQGEGGAVVGDVAEAVLARNGRGSRGRTGATASP